MNHQGNLLHHLIAFATVFIWGTTFISTKVLLQAFSPVEILFFRFFIGYLALSLFCRRLKITSKTQEFHYMAAGLCGVTLYFLLENFALTFTLAANVGVLIAVSPLFTAIFSYIFLNGQRPGLPFGFGLVVALYGVYLISFQSDAHFTFNPAGDILAFFAAVVWAMYSTIMKKISGFGYSTLQITRRTFFYGLLFMTPAMFLYPLHFDLSRFMDIKNSLNLLFLSLGASALCFATWNFAVKKLGPVKTSVYIYIVPVITVVTSVLILNEVIAPTAYIGIALTLSGVFISEGKWCSLKAIGKVCSPSSGK